MTPDPSWFNRRYHETHDPEEQPPGLCPECVGWHDLIPLGVALLILAVIFTVLAVT